jgi:dipeptidyl aminopeptidase/acylaminoacyl peptidase
MSKLRFASVLTCSLLFTLVSAGNASGAWGESWPCTSFLFIPISLRAFSPPCEGGVGGGVGGGGPGATSAWYAVPGRLDPAETLPRQKVLVMPCSPPLTPPSQGGVRDGSDDLDPPVGDDSGLSPQPPQRGPGPGQGESLVFKTRIAPHWFHRDTRFWYRNDLPGKAKEFMLVDAERGTREKAFDHEKLAAALSKVVGGEVYKADKLPFDSIEFVDDSKAILFQAGAVTWKYNLASEECTKFVAAQTPPATTSPDRGESSQQRRRPDTQRGRGDGGPSGGVRSPDGKWVAFVKDHGLFLRADGKPEEIPLGKDGKPGLAYGRLEWAPDSKTLVAFRIEPGDRKEVHLIQSSPAGGGRAVLRSRPYPLPGDKFTAYELNLFDVASRTQLKPKVDRIDYEGPRLHWDKDGRHFAYEKIERGHQRYRLIRVDSHTGDARNLIDEKTETFIWTAHREAVNLRTITWLDATNELIYASERDGWRHLYLIDAKTGVVKNSNTKGSYVVRGIDKVDEEKRQIWFSAGGKNADQDPYFVHFYRVNFDGTALVALTEGNGNHTIQYSPDRRFLIDTYSRVDMAPVHELRSTADGKRICRLEQADIRALEATGWKPPEVFVAKGRDGKTDIWGVIHRPRDFDPNKKYPVIESIYAGPQGSFVPKSFSPGRRFASLTDAGFIVSQIDGMGTANRSKAFHDVCWHNLKDAGFPDRILWHQAVARKDPSYDISRVGIFGGSAGGQNSTGAVLFHPDFYKVAVSSCGCHDNRMDKASWNEQWMGFPVGPWYSASSNIDNAAKLRGKLLLIVGEMDTNVPPESTMRLVDALIKAGKDFELLVVPGANHGNGGPYGQRRMHDFFVKHLLGGETPNDNGGPSRDESAARAAAAPADKKPLSPTPARLEPLTTTFDLADLNDARSELRGVIERYTVDRGSLQRSLPPAASTQRDERIHEFTARWLDQLGKLDFHRLSHDAKVDDLLFKNHLTHELRQIELRGRERAAAAPLVPFAAIILDLDASRRELKPMDWSKVAGSLTRLTGEISKTRSELDKNARGKESVKKTVANHALAEVESLRNALRGWFSFYDGYDPVFTWWIQEPYKGADAGLEAYASFLRQRLRAVTAGIGDNAGPGPGGGPGRRRGAGGREETAGQGPGAAPAGPREENREIIGNPIGREALLSELKYEMISYTPEELIEIAQKELKWCEDEMKKAAREMGHGDDWRAALEHVKTIYVEPGKQPTLIRDLAIEAMEYLDAHDLVTVPPLCRESWRIAMMSPERQLVNPFFTGGPTISVSYPTSTMSHEAKMMSMRGNNIHFSRATVHHELIPGHHLQGYMNSRYKTYRGLFSTPFWMEGWALYWELLLWDKGFAKSPENKVGMLFWRMHRCARIIFSLGFHLEKMSPRECIDLLVNRIGHERDNATAEVRRSFTTSYGPLYQAAYLLGGLQLHALHREMVDSGKMTDRDFHDAILKENDIPIDMVRALLSRQSLTPDYTPDWKFYDKVPTPR